jgi:hypothetical protein
VRHSYGIIDRRKVLVYKPQLFKKTDDILVFPSKEFGKWHSEITEYLDGIYQINSKNLEKGRYVDIEDLNLTLGLLFNINDELENIFNPDNKMDFSYNYVSIMDEKYKKRKSNYYGRYMHKIDRRAIKITPMIKYMHMMEILDYAHKQWSLKEGYNQKLKIKPLE